jgi:hypothetical protein
MASNFTEQGRTWCSARTYCALVLCLVLGFLAPSGAEGGQAASVCDIWAKPRAFDHKPVLLKAEIIANDNSRRLVDQQCPSKCVYLSGIPGDLPRNESEYESVNAYLRDAIMFDNSRLLTVLARVEAVFQGEYRLRSSTDNPNGNTLHLRSVSDIRVAGSRSFSTVSGKWPGELLGSDCFRKKLPGN